MEIKHDPARKRFDLYDDIGRRVGELEYKGGRGKLLATHTEVFQGFEGKGYAGQLLDALVAYAREVGAKIVPVCPYVQAQFTRKPELYADVIAPGEAEK